MERTDLPKATRSPFEITVYFCAFVGVTNAFGIYLFSVLIPEMRASLSLGLDFVGLATGLGQAGVMVGSMLCGFLTPRLGPLRLVFMSIALCAVCLSGMTFVSQPALIAILLLLLGGAAAAVWVSVVVVTREVIPQAHQGKALGVMASTGTAAGVFLTGLLVPPLVEHWGWRSAWLIVGVTSSAIAMVGYVRLRPLQSKVVSISSRKRERRAAILPTDVSKATTGLLLAMSLLNGLTFLPFQTYLTSLLQMQFGWSLVNAKTCWSLIGLGSILGGVVFGYVSDRISARLTLVIAYSCLTISVLGSLLGDVQLLVFGAVLVFGLAYGAVFGQTAAYITKTQSASAVAFLSGATYVAFGLGSMAGNYVIGEYAESTGDFVTTYSIIALGVFALVILTLCLSSDRRRDVSPVHVA